MTWDLRLGDCFDPVTGLAAIADGSVDHVICDPPYSVRTQAMLARARTKNRPQVYQRVRFAPLASATVVGLACHAARITRRWFLAFSDLESVEGWRHALEAHGMRYVRTCVWVKPNAAPQFSGDRPAQAAEAIVVAHSQAKLRWNGRGKRNVYVHARCQGAGHPTAKPINLMRQLVADFTDPGDLVCDPFAGSGTTGVAAVDAGRRFVGWEVDAKYFALASHRLRTATHVDDAA